jgi:hypothetical protein
MTASPLGAVLTSSPPEFPEDAASRALDDYWGLTGRLRRLTSERDVNYHLATRQGDYVLKLANPAEPPRETDFQIRALIHLRGSTLPVPRVVLSLAGLAEVNVPQGRLRLLTYVQGRPLHAAPRSDAQRRAVGAAAGRLAAALADFHHPAARRDLVWDIRHTGRLRPLLPAIADPALRRLAAAGMDRFDSSLAPILPSLPTQVVHNDLNPHNMLVSEDDPEIVTGVLDFGDMVETPRLLDLGIAACYQIDPLRPAETITAVAAGYHAVNPISAVERQLLPLAVEARLVTTLCIAHERARLYPDNAPYILRNVPVSSAALTAFSQMPPGALNALLDRSLR